MHTLLCDYCEQPTTDPGHLGAVLTVGSSFAGRELLDLRQMQTCRRRSDVLAFTGLIQGPR